MPFNLGLPELILIAFLAVLFFGRDKLSDLAGDMGKSIKTFKKELQEVKDDLTIEQVTTEPSVSKTKRSRK